MIQTAVLSPVVWGDDVWRTDSKLYRTSISPPLSTRSSCTGLAYWLAAAVWYHRARDVGVGEACWTGAGGKVASALRFGQGVYVYAYAVAQLLLLLLLAECLPA